ncbi:ATP-binding protein [uncultured Porphyromonas sp.]|jgi:ATP-binding region ATPase domain protein|uniref:ATP-binding protein n=1 Tax=uncultured Porphyromonas sp. TaxID=159274 RepID=UPI002637D72D|nr:ATP-binding protein [uncultured Porphyromonas sp.]
MKNEFRFNISLQILNHLGRNLYRNFITVLGEAISNSWDADAPNVWVEIDREKNTMSICDDGVGMSEEDFQDKFLKIGYTKRSTGLSKTQKGRPFIGRKGIGKLALLSCAKNITILSKVKGGELVGGVINNEELDQAIKDDLNSNEYSLGTPSAEAFNQSETLLQERGTLIIFDQLNDGIRNRMEYICKLVALHFRFSLIDKEFSIYINGELVTADALSDLAATTEFIWKTDGFNDPFLDLCDPVKETSLLKIDNPIAAPNLPFSGFIASVEKPSHLKVRGLSDERLGIDLFVNGRLREKDFFRNISSSKHGASYLYGQIHINNLDDGGSIDRFTSSREGVLGNDPLIRDYLVYFEEMLRSVGNEWDKFRLKHKEDGDPENESLTPETRKAKELFDLLSRDYTTKEDRRVNEWLDEVRWAAYSSLTAYGDCFIAENLLRNYLEESLSNAEFSEDFKKQAMKFREKEKKDLQRIGCSDEIRAKTSEPYYVHLSDLLREIYKDDPTFDETSITKLRVLRNAVAHTCVLTEQAQSDLVDEVAEVRERIKTKLRERRDAMV